MGSAAIKPTDVTPPRTQAQRSPEWLALPAGLEQALRAHIGALFLLHSGKGHVILRLDFPGDARKPASWQISVGGDGEEQRT